VRLEHSLVLNRYFHTTMDGYILTQSKREEIPGAEDKDWPALEREHRLLQQDDDYVAKLLAGA
jgi:hypothetical protein